MCKGVNIQGSILFLATYTIMAASEYLIHLAHIFIFSSLLGYIGIAQSTIPKFMYSIILFVGAVVVGYHVYKSFFKKDAWINYIHILIVGPLLMYIGLVKEETPRKVFELVLMLAFASFGYHGYYLVKPLLDTQNG
uniref:Uncharacterized protein n=1 Tax=viral metagenome TaxID=1070528 RepID=A0A6C0I5J1_9ZZZZ